MEPNLSSAALLNSWRQNLQKNSIESPTVKDLILFLQSQGIQQTSIDAALKTAMPTIDNDIVTKKKANIVDPKQAAKDQRAQDLEKKKADKAAAQAQSQQELEKKKAEQKAIQDQKQQEIEKQKAAEKAALKQQILKIIKKMNATQIEELVREIKNA